jgi:cytoskeletal protein CcmA (bactofilin family)
MFESKKGEIVVNEGAAETIVGTSVKLKGNLKSDGDIIVDGVVAGEIKTKGSVKIGKNANIIANIKAKNVSVSGAVQGNIEATDRLELLETGKVLGDVSANVLSIAAGAVFSGKSQMNDSHKDSEVMDEPTAELEGPEEIVTDEEK